MLNHYSKLKLRMLDKHHQLMIQDMEIIMKDFRLSISITYVVIYKLKIVKYYY